MKSRMTRIYFPDIPELEIFAKTHGISDGGYSAEAIHRLLRGWREHPEAFPDNIISVPVVGPLTGTGNNVKDALDNRAKLIREATDGTNP